MIFCSQSTSANQIGPLKPAFPAYSQANGQPSLSNQQSQNNSNSIDKQEPKKPALITLTTDNSRIVHPEEDISLVSIFCL